MYKDHTDEVDLAAGTVSPYDVTRVVEPGDDTWQVFGSACGAVDFGGCFPVPNGIARVSAVGRESGGASLELEQLDL